MILRSLLASLLTLAPLSVVAQESVPPKRRPLNPRQIIRAWDLNKDMKLSEGEFSKSGRARNLPPEAQRKIFAHLDRNKNGSISLHELRMAYGGVGNSVSPDLLEELDVNKDGRISRDEFDASERFAPMFEKRRERIFTRLDVNRDGFLSHQDRPAKTRKGAGRYFNRLDVDQTGKLSLEEFGESQQARKLLQARFDFLDRDGDGKLSEKELYRKGRWKPFDGDPKSEKEFRKKNGYPVKPKKGKKSAKPKRKKAPESKEEAPAEKSSK